MLGISESAFPVCRAGQWVFSCRSYLRWLVQLGSCLSGCQVQHSVVSGKVLPPIPQVYTWLLYLLILV